MNCFVGLGSNQGERLENLERAARRLKALSRDGFLRASPVFENRPLLPAGAPANWDVNFLNAAVQIHWNGTPGELLGELQKIETDMGRIRLARWSPRTLDLDLLEISGQTVSTSDLKIPHPEMLKRQFVLAPLKHLGSAGMLARSRVLKEQLPVWMGIMNLTPDSFSDGGEVAALRDFESRAREWIAEGVHALDLGAESTRPGATPLTQEQEWSRLRPALEFLRGELHGRVFRPLVSVDTRHARTAEYALELGADVINDVSGLSDRCMLAVLKHSSCQYVLMHSKSVPAVSGDHWDVTDPVAALRDWALEKLELLDREGVALSRVMLDPGIGFGKSPTQSVEILRRIDELLDLPVRVLVGHSRKSFMNLWTKKPFADRDAETVALSMKLAARGVDVLRVHRPVEHARAWRAYQEIP
jgi:2-amino-4-hydroxy-6-hydroxymethyldihydropteridine diphosphokinase / dihydropteroate synthase